MNESWVNPLTNRNGRGFKVLPDVSADKRKCLIELQKVVPAGHRVMSFRYVTSDSPADTVVEISVRPPTGPAVRYEARAPRDRDGRPWSTMIARVLAAYLKAQY